MKKITKTLYCLALSVMMCGWQSVVAQPGSPAPTPPSREEGTVKSVFSDAYPQFAKFQEEYADWDNLKTKKEIITPFAGSTDRVLKIDDIVNGTNAQIALGTCNWSDMETLHVDIYSPGDNQGIGEFDFSLVSGWGSANGQAGIWLNITQEAKHDQWISLDIPIKTFKDAGVNLADVNIIRFRRGSKGSVGKLLYVDNVYAYKSGGSTGGGDDDDDDDEKEGITIDKNDPGNQTSLLPHLQAPTPPVRESAGVKPLFSDAYTGAGQFQLEYADWNDNATSKTLITPFDDKTDNVLKLDNLLNNNQAQIALGTCNLGSMDMLHLDIYSPGSDQGIGEFDFGFIHAWSGGNHVAANIWLNITGENLHGRWISIDIPLSKFKEAGTDLTNVNILRLRRGKQGSPGKLLYVDNIYAYKKGSGTIVDGPVDPPITVPTVDIDASRVKSIFCEQFEDADYQDNQGILFDGIYYGQPANQKAEFATIVEGNKSLKLTNWLDFPFKIHKTSEVMDLSDMDYLHAHIYQMGDLDENKKVAGATFWMHGKDDAGSVTRDVAFSEIKRGEWVSISIPMCYFKDAIDLTKGYLLRLRLGGYNSMDVYVDNIFAYKGEPIAGSIVAEDCQIIELPCTEPIADKTTSPLPPVDRPYLGINLASASGGNNPGTFGYDYMYPKLDDLYYFKAKGVRLIRLPFRWKRIQSQLNGELTKRDIDAMKVVIDEAERLGMWVMLDMHDFCERTEDIDGKHRLYEIGVAGYREWNTAANGWGTWTADTKVVVTADHFADVWLKLVDAFKDNKNIWGYDLMNEPKGLDINILKSNYQTVINAIRQVDTKTAIVIEGKDYAGAQGWPNHSDVLKDLTDPIGNNIIYQAHCYFDGNSSGTYSSTYDSEVKNPEIYKQRLDPFINWLKTNNKKGMIGEFGVPYNEAKGGDPRYMDLIDNVFAYLKENKVTATYWCGGAMYDAYHITVQPAKDYCTEKSTMAVMEKYTWNFHCTDDNDPDCGTTDIDADVVSVEDGISVYPNPVIDQLIVRSEVMINNYQIMNMLGQVVDQAIVSATRCEVACARLTSGYYLLKLQLEDGSTVVRKITKK